MKPPASAPSPAPTSMAVDVLACVVEPTIAPAAVPIKPRLLMVEFMILPFPADAGCFANLIIILP
mgnify:CR=1 FL=1